MSAKETTEPAAHAKRLLDMKDGEHGVILTNGDRKSTEMGLFPGVRVVMFRNRKPEQSLVIGAGDARFLISRAIAKEVLVDLRG